MVLRFAATIFVSATLLFACQPMVARMIVPLLGGAPSVWIVCSLCFQALVLAGYAYAHIVGSRLSIRAQVVMQVVIVAAALMTLPLAIDEKLALELTAKSYSLGVLAVLLRSVGLPFFVLSTSAPLVQRWFAEAGEKDPYFLYAASNAGSMLALLGYPFVIEPLLGLSNQSKALFVGYAVYGVLIAICAVTLVQRAKSPSSAGAMEVGDVDPTPPAERWRQRLVWLGLSFAPSSLLLGVTDFITTDIASIPLLWVVPLATYLATFIVAFAKKKEGTPRTKNFFPRAFALLAVVTVISMVAEVVGPAWLLVMFHFGLLFVAGVVCHGALANRRPHVSRLTEFFLLMSVGGVLGGIWNGLVAPAIFRDLYEYPIAIFAAGLGRALVLKDEPETKKEPFWRSFAIGGVLPVIALLLTFAVGAAKKSFMTPVYAVSFQLVAITAFIWSGKHPTRFATAISGLLVCTIAFGPSASDLIHKERDFFGTLKVRTVDDGKFRILMFGTTIHGAQYTDPALARSPIINFHPSGPAGDLLGPLPGDPEYATAPPRRMGVIGLGIGGLTGYARPGDQWTYFELNPAIVRVAKEHYTLLSTLPERATFDVEVGDARLRIRDGAPARFDVLVMDAFSSDAIPVHLMTREAIAVNVRAMVPGGLLIAHVSNRHLSLAPVVAALAKDAGLHAIVRWDGKVTPEQKKEFKELSLWTAMSADPKVLDAIKAKNPNWKTLEPPPGQKVWTDDYADVLGAMKF
ncbi:MAG: fused MFS/spermidine synthase [Deltaproteobacteria bacterium]|nr:fused MFS/spermidine synthase [Deltaproteobacteria bacterium]